MGCFHSSENNTTLVIAITQELPGKWQVPELHQAVNQRKINTVPALHIDRSQLHIRRTEKPANDVETVEDTMELDGR